MADVLELTVSVDEINNVLKDAVVFYPRETVDRLTSLDTLPETPESRLDAPKPKTSERVTKFPDSFRRRPQTFKIKIRPWHSASERQRQRRMQVCRHKLGLAVLCFRDRGYCLTDRVTSHVRENDLDWMDSLLCRMRATSSTVIYVTDEASFQKWQMLVRKAQDGYLNAFTVVKLNAAEGKCPTCDKNCMRFVAVRALNSLRRVPVDPIPHGKQ